jgi:dolichol-phosphate mannosyltransferase
MQKNNLIVCPVYNEERYLERFYAGLREHYAGDVVFVEDGSIDASRDIIRRFSDKRTFFIGHRQKTGYGAALLSGFNWALERAYQRVVTIDTDLQHNPEHIYMFFRQLIESEVVLGSRYIKIGSYGEIPRERLTINRYISRLINALFCENISDPFCGFRGYRSSFLRRARLREKGYNLGLEILLELIRLSASFKEVPVEAIYCNPHRRFGGGLDNPRARLCYYLSIISAKKREIDNEKKVFSGQPASGRCGIGSRGDNNPLNTGRA